jgi:hypothetical protein
MVNKEKENARDYLIRVCKTTNVSKRHYMDAINTICEEQPLPQNVEASLEYLKGSAIHNEDIFAQEALYNIKQALQSQTQRIKELEAYKKYALSVGSVQSSKVPKLQNKLNAISEIFNELDEYFKMNKDILVVPSGNPKKVSAFQQQIIIKEYKILKENALHKIKSILGDNNE